MSYARMDEGLWHIAEPIYAKLRLPPDAGTLSLQELYLQYANTDGRVGHTTAVGTFREVGDASPSKCHDMAGNVWEWTSSRYNASGYQTNAQLDDLLDTTAQRVLHGGSFKDIFRRARSAARYECDPDFYGNNIGFRVARGALTSTR